MEETSFYLAFYFRFNQRGFQWTMSMIFAINEINKSQMLLSNITLGYVINDNCFRMQKSIENSLKYIEPSSENVDPCFYQVVVTVLSSSQTVAIDHLLEIFHTPQVLFFVSTVKARIKANTQTMYTKGSRRQ